MTPKQDETIAVELARVGVAIVYKDELIPAEEMFPQLPSGEHPNGSWKRWKEDGTRAIPDNAPLIDARETTVHRLPKGSPEPACMKLFRLSLQRGESRAGATKREG